MKLRDRFILPAIGALLLLIAGRFTYKFWDETRTRPVIVVNTSPDDIYVYVGGGSTINISRDLKQTSWIMKPGDQVTAERTKDERFGLMYYWGDKKVWEELLIRWDAEEVSVSIDSTGKPILRQR